MAKGLRKPPHSRRERLLDWRAGARKVIRCKELSDSIFRFRRSRALRQSARSLDTYCRQVATYFLFAKSRATLLVAYAGELGAESLSIEHVCGFGDAGYNGCRRPGTDSSTG